MAFKILSKSDFNKVFLNFSDESRRSLIIFSNSPVVFDKSLRKFSAFVFAFGFVLFIFLISFQFWAIVIENPQILSSKPYFHIVTSIPFSFEITLVFVGILVFLRLLLVNYERNKTLTKEVKEKLEELDKDSVLIYSQFEEKITEMFKQNKNNIE